MDSATSASAQNNQTVIVYRGYGDTCLYAATLPNAMKLFEQHVSALPQEVKDIAASYEERGGLRFTSAKFVSAALLEVLTLDVGAKAGRLRSLVYGPPPTDREDDRPEMLVQAEWKHELALFMVAYSLTKQYFTSGDPAFLYEREHVEKHLSFLAPFAERAQAGVRYVAYDDYFEMAREYRTIFKGHWKPDAPEKKVVARICVFIQEYLVDRSDIRIEVADVLAVVP